MMRFIKDKKGLTLIETVVAVAVMTILMGMITLFIIRSFYLNRFAIEQGLNAAALQNAIRSFTTNLREAKQSDEGGYMIESGDDFEMTFFSNIDDDDGTERLHYYFESGQLKMGVTEPVGSPVSYPAGDDEIRTVGNGVVNTASQPIFYYYTRDYPEDLTNNPLTTPVNPQQASMVKIDLHVNVNTDQVPDSMRMETFVRPRNIDY